MFWSTLYIEKWMWILKQTALANAFQLWKGEVGLLIGRVEEMILGLGDFDLWRDTVGFPEAGVNRKKVTGVSNQAKQSAFTCKWWFGIGAISSDVQFSNYGNSSLVFLLERSWKRKVIGERGGQRKRKRDRERGERGEREKERGRERKRGERQRREREREGREREREREERERQGREGEKERGRERCIRRKKNWKKKVPKVFHSHLFLCVWETQRESTWLKETLKERGNWRERERERQTDRQTDRK